MELIERIRINQARIDELSDSFNESTGLTWLWALVFGPIYFAVHGFWSRAALIFVLNFLIIGFLIAPFIAYPAWRIRAKEKAERALLLDAAERSGRTSQG
ncbi:DUF2628 domain-containing protein [Paracoccaceae bacterium Fryx2]|nr:DUF2628 domain-containing protein [Paracoccaceae bacterium Fryx2]